jgi:peptide/nickel transport system substrate-binding protein
MSDRIGQQFGNYRLVALLGQGGFAEVYLGQHVRLNLQAAIKVLHTHLTEQEVAHFQQEAETIATLIHPAIVRILDYDVQEGIPFLVMDYAPGGSLRRRYPKGTLVPLPQIVSSVKQVAAGLHYAHERKFIHRDVKPENILVGRQEEVLLSDFGLAALAQSSASLSTQEAIGTLPYMAPEQIEGHPRAASDQYALGVVVYEWLCGSRPFEGSATEVMVQHLTMPPPPLHEQVATIPLGIEQVVLRALAKDPKARFASVQDFATALEDAGQHAYSPTAQLASEQPPLSPVTATGYATVAVAPDHPVLPAESTPEASLPVGALEPTVYPDSPAPHGLDTPQSGAVAETPQPGHFVAPTAAVVPAPLEPTMPVQQKSKRLPRTTAALLMGLVVVIIAGGILGSLSLLAHFGVLGARSGATTPAVARGGTWIDAGWDPGSLIPNGNGGDQLMDQTLYLPLFYGDTQGVIHPGAASELPTVQNGGISADATTWTFHLRPGLVWSDGKPYDARDVDYTWRLWANPKFGAYTTLGLNLITSADVSADYLSITFHLKRPFVPFLADLWVDGIMAPLPAHHFSSMAPEAILNSPDNLNPQVTSGPFMMSESVPGKHYTLVRNPRYYRAREGLPYLDKVMFRIPSGDEATILQDLQAGTIDSTRWPDVTHLQAYQRLRDYTIVTTPTNGNFEALYFNFHNTVLASHLEVRQAMAMAIDQQAVIQQGLLGFGEVLCDDHPSAYRPGWQAGDPFCPEFNPAAANKLLDDNGWVRGADGVRTRGGQRLEFEYSTASNGWRPHVEAIVQRNLQAIGIKLDIQNYPGDTFFGPFLTGGKASPPTGAVAGRYDIAEWSNNFGYDPDDSSLLSCDQIPSAANNFSGGNRTFYCNPALDALYKQELATTDPGVRQHVFEQLHQIYLTDFPFVTLFGGPTWPAIVRKGTHNYQLSPFRFGPTNIWEWWCDNGKC